ncbi:MAG: hypothetical protein JWO43_264 [Candidatus Adlerbacteria bacterium]|nr:hypothetical protein [Candidatus Adlerbacteria bacterium]
MNVQVIVFDFDGVIVSHSEFFKEVAWLQVFAPYTGRYEAAFAEARLMYGWGKKGDRFDILRHVYEKIGEPAELIPALVESGARMFDVLVQKSILEAGAVPGAADVLAQLNSQYPLYINSGTAQLALARSIQSLGLMSHFKGTLGGPTSKSENMRTISEQTSTGLDAILLVGDSVGDTTAALETRCQFIGVANEWNRWDRNPQTFPLIRDLRELPGLLT